MTSLQVITALLTLGAISRTTRLLTDDSLTAPLRSLFERKAAPRPAEDGTAKKAPLPWRALSTWVQCPWCVSPWMAAGAAAAHWFYGDTQAFRYAVAALTASHLVSLGADWLDSPPPQRVLKLEPLDVTLDPVQLRLNKPAKKSAS